MASFGYDAYGLEISETAVQRCKEEHEKNGHKYPAKDEKKGVGSVHFINGDFFDKGLHWILNVTELESSQTFQLIYDYTVREAIFELVLEESQRIYSVG